MWHQALLQLPILSCRARSLPGCKALPADTVPNIFRSSGYAASSCVLVAAIAKVGAYIKASPA